MNIMQFFVTREEGTSSLLATALDPQCADKDKRQRLFREKFCTRLRAWGVDLLADGPAPVLLEHRGMDLLMVWGDWILILENKVAAASITRGQLQGYYDAAVTKKGRLDQQRLGGLSLNPNEIRNKRICIVFVTPKETGDEEFRSVRLNKDRTDAKVHLSWQDLLDDLDHAFPEGTASDPFGTAIRDACKRTAELLEKYRVEPPIWPPERVASKRFVEDVRLQVEGMIRRFQPDLKLYVSPDSKFDQLYGHIGGNSGNVDFRLWPTDTTLVNQDNTILNGWVRFKITDKAIGKRSEEFSAVPVEIWASILGLSSDGLRYDEDECSVTHERRWSGRRDDLVKELASLFSRCLMVFRPFMADQQAVRPFFQWDEESFFRALEERDGAVVAEARAILEWARPKAQELCFGTGKKDGSVFPLFGNGQRLFLLWTYGKVMFPFNWMKASPPFSDESKRREMIARLNHIPGIRIPEDSIDIQPTFDLALLNDEKKHNEFVGVLQWAVNQISGEPN